MSKNRFDSYPLPDWLQFWLEQNAGRPPLWDLPAPPSTADGFWFEKLTFENRHLVLETFENDPDPWVDKRFKDPKKLYEYVAHLRICLPYSGKRGGCDWLVRSPGWNGECVGILHNFGFSRETYGYQNRKCTVGFAFAEKVRGTGFAERIMRHFHEYLFKKMNRLLLLATVDKGNARSIRFLEKLGYENRTKDFFEEGDKEHPDYFFELYRSRQAKAWVQNYRTFLRHPASRATAWVFLGEGIIFGTWAASVPFVKEKFGLDEAQLGLLLLCLPLGVMLTNPFTVSMLHRFGTATATWGSLAAAAALFIFPFLTSSLWFTGFGLVAAGASLACTNVFMNTCASQLEQFGGLRIMSTCHGVWSLGGMFGSAVAGMATGFGAPHLAYVFVLCTLLFIVALRIRPALAGVPEDPNQADVPPEKPPVFVKPNRALWILIVISLCTNLTEGTMADWSAVYVREVVGADEAMVGYGFAAYAFFMATGRLLGDGLIASIGSKKLLMIGGVVVAAGFTLSALVPQLWAVLLGFAMVGWGVALGAPITYAASAKVPGMAKGAGLATMNSFAMAGFLTGPALIGFLAKGFSLPVAFLVVAGTACLWVWQSRKVV